MYKYETHLHTSPSSACGVSSGKEMAEYYKENGYAGFVVTDHFFNGNCGISDELPWKERVREFCKGYEEALERGKELDLDVFFGFEFNYKGKGAEFLAYGLDEKRLCAIPQIVEISLKKSLELLKSEGAYIIQAHPFREAPYIESIVLIPNLTDAVEILNGGNMFRDPKANDNANIYADMYNLTKISGTDIHEAGKHIYGGIETEKRIKTSEELIEVLRNEDFKVIWNA